MNKFMKSAVGEASKGIKKNEGGPFGAVIVRKGKIIATAHNNVLKTNDPTAHAEILAIRRASAKLKRFDLSDCEIYSSCEPCPMCLGAIVWARIKTVYYGCTSSDAANIGFEDKLIYDIFKGKKLPGFTKKGIDRKECLKVFSEWKKNKDRRLY